MARKLPIVVALAALASPARADDRIDLAGIPDAQILEPAFHLDRGDYSPRSKRSTRRRRGCSSATARSSRRS